ncbi:MAG: acid phosphatase [Sphingobacteriia bacterium]|nr:acid phosphatase [Sphingobacteriia bacterium]NCC39801.1 acid phosphatase [Gammaproteobacteria bacterium]
MRLAYTAPLLFALASPTLALNIVLTNDDGFETHNIQALHRALVAAGHDVILSAPYAGQSGTSAQVAFLQPIPPTRTPSAGGLLPAGSPGVGETGIAPQQYYVDGSPTASLLYGIDVKALEIWGHKPDLVISGPNEGNNLGIITPHSGTLGAAVTALNKEIPAIAVSAEGSSADDAEIVAALVVKLVSAIDHRGRVALPAGIGLNLNTPAIDAVNSSAEDFSFKLTRIGESANFGLQFFVNIGDSPIAQGYGIPADIGLPGVSLVIPPSVAGYPIDPSPLSETNALEPLVVTVSPIQGTYAADRMSEIMVRFPLLPLLNSQR